MQIVYCWSVSVDWSNNKVRPNALFSFAPWVEIDPEQTAVQFTAHWLADYLALPVQSASIKIGIPSSFLSSSDKI